MRGKVAYILSFQAVPGITPAYAGKSLLEHRQQFGTWDHPRLCGEKVLGVVHALYHVGSPPPMRGKDHALNVAFAITGITPAYAGKSVAAPLEVVYKQDHPRLCGEKHLLLGWLPDFMGSPPPMRGKVIAIKML